MVVVDRGGAGLGQAPGPSALGRRIISGVKLALCTAVAIAAAVTTAVLAQIGQTGAPDARKTVDTYCVGCHNSKAKAGGLALDALNLDPSTSLGAGAVQEHADVWEKALRKLRGRQMPPPGSRQPDQKEIDAFVAWMESALDAPPVSAANASARRPRAGHVPIQRLTRTEFAAAANDLLGIELDAESLLPAEIEVHGFDNIAAALSISPAFLDQYVAASRVAAKMAVGEAKPKLTSAFYPQPLTADQPSHVDGLPLGRSEEHTSELQSQSNLVCRLLLEKKNTKIHSTTMRLHK